MLKVIKFGCPRCLAIACLLLISGKASAQLDPLFETPYQLDVVVSFGQHRVLTSVFQDQFEKQIKDLLVLTYGNLAEVNIFRSHPLLPEIRKRGLRQVLDGLEQLSERKTHFVLVDYRNGKYHLQTRQHDGSTGLSSATVRSQEISDRRQLVRLGALLIDRDFGLTGTILSGNNSTVELGLRGGKLGVPLDHWVKPGDLFAVNRIVKIGSKLQPQRMEWGILRVLTHPRDGICRCEYFHRFETEKLATNPNIAGYRCLRLTTTTSPISLQLIPDKKDRPLDSLQIHVGKENYQDQVKEIPVDAEGRIKTNQPYSHVAFIRVVSGTTVLAEFPVALVNDRTIACRIHFNPETASQGQIFLRQDRWLRRIYEDLRIVVDRVADLNATLERSPEAALEQAKNGLKNLKKELSRLRQEEDLLREEAKKLAVKMNFQEGEQRIEELAHREVELGQFIEKLSEVLKADERTKKVQALVEQARLLEIEAKFDQALALYDRIVAKYPDQIKVKEHLKNLRGQWDLAQKNPDLAKARAFIYNTWPEDMDTAKLKKVLPEAKKALEVCNKLGDRLTPRKMLPANMKHAAYFKKRLEILGHNIPTEDNRSEASTILSLNEDLRNLHNQARAFVGETNPPMK